VVGRCANRIANAEFSIGGEKHKLLANNGPNALHGMQKSEETRKPSNFLFHLFMKVGLLVSIREGGRLLKLRVTRGLVLNCIIRAHMEKRYICVPHLQNRTKLTTAAAKLFDQTQIHCQTYYAIC
jgi:hypothetical protein